MSSFAEYPNYDGLGLAELVRSGQVTALELVEAALEQIEQLNPALNAVITRMDVQARQRAQAPLPAGPFQGVPMLLKDIWATYAGVPTSAGNRVLRTIPSQHDSASVQRYHAAGAIIVGKSNTPEFACVPTTEPEVFGPARNPWQLERTPGGSSGGAAAAVAARMVPLAHATDGGGSIRIPAACCGIFGLKVSRGRMALGPDQLEMWSGLGVEHVVSRSVRDSAAMLDASLGSEVGAPYAAPTPQRPFLSEVTTAPGRLRIAFTDHPFFGGTVHPECRRGLENTVKLLEALGHELVEATPVIDRELCTTAMLQIVASEVRADMQQAARLAGRPLTPADFDLTTYALGLLGARVSLSEHKVVQRALDQTKREIGRFFQGYDILLTPTLAQPPQPLGFLDATALENAALRVINRLNAGWLLEWIGVTDTIIDKVYGFMPYTAPFNMTGQPAMSVPLHWSADGLPIGMQFVGRYGDEATLLRLAGQLEQARPWAARWPSAIPQPAAR